MNTPSRFRLATLSAALLWPIGVMAQATNTSTDQTTPPANSEQNVNLPDKTPEQKKADQENIVALSPFEVSSTKDTGYVATDTLAGTRIRTPLADVGASISVYTAQFMQDVGATDAGTLLSYTTNAQVAGPQGTFAGVGNGATVDESGNLRSPATAQSVRGLAAADNARDYYVTDIPFDSYNTSRVDILRGPNSILYGLGSPAGIINQGLNEAEFRNFGDVDLRFDSWGSFRSSLDINQVIIPDQLSIRIDSMVDDRKYEQKQAFQNEKRIYGALRYDPKLFKTDSAHTTIKANIENGYTSADRPRTVTPNDALTPFWNSKTVSTSNPFGGMGQQVATNVYDPYRTDVTGGSYGMLAPASSNYAYYMSDVANQQQPIWFYNGTGQFLGAYGGYINNAAVNATGGLTGVSNGLVNKYQNGMLYTLQNLPQAAVAGNFPGAQYGQYRNMSLTDPSVFNFYDNLIDGPTASEWENFTTGEVDFTQTFLNDRIGIDLSYDEQKYTNGADFLLGGSPTLTLDVTENLANYYQTPGANGETTITNPNFGRALIASSGGGGGTSYTSDRKYARASIFGEVKGSDFNWAPWFSKLIGSQRFNGVASNEQYWNENRSWQNYANSQAWDGYWNDNNGANNAFYNRPPVAVVYLGGPISGRSSASGANIPGVTSQINLATSGVNVFDTTWNGGTSYGSPWVVPTNLSAAFNGNPTGGSIQASNPMNYTGWNTNFVDNLISDRDGSNPTLLTLAQKQLRETISEAGSYQGYFWQNALVVTYGWRYDEVKTKSATAQQNPSNRTELDVSPQDYYLADGFPANGIVKGHSLSGSAVLHLNQFLPKDPLPFNVSLSYNESSNFQVTSQRVDVYGKPLANPTGKTVEYGVLLSTKNNMFSLKIDKYKTSIANASAGLGSSGTLGSVIAQGLRWRNVFLYNLGGYDMTTANQPSYRNTWTNAYPTETASQAAAEEDAAITGWNNIQAHLQTLGFFNAWNFTPTNASALTSESTYLANPSAYQPTPSTVYAYTATAPSGFTVTADTISQGDEAEFTFNPLPNWRISFNGAKTTAVRNDVGGPTIDSFVNYITTQLINPDGTLTPAGKLPQYGSAASAIYPNIWGPFLANYTLLKLQEGAAVPELRKYRFNLITNYEFTSGMLKAVGIGGGYRWEDKNIIGYPVNTTTGTFELNQPYYGPSDGYVDLWASYHHRIMKGIEWKIQLNIRNAFAKNGLIPVTVEPDGKTWATVRTKPVQEATIENTFSF